MDKQQDPRWYYWKILGLNFSLWCSFPVKTDKIPHIRGQEGALRLPYFSVFYCKVHTWHHCTSGHERMDIFRPPKVNIIGLVPESLSIFESWEAAVLYLVSSLFRRVGSFLKAAKEGCCFPPLIIFNWVVRVFSLKALSCLCPKGRCWKTNIFLMWWNYQTLITLLEACVISQLLLLFCSPRDLSSRNVTVYASELQKLL